MYGQFFKLCIGAGICPPRWMNLAGEKRLIFMTGPLPKRPPNSRVSPSLYPPSGI